MGGEGPAELHCGLRCHPYPLLGNLDPRTRARGVLGGEGLVPLRGAEAFLGAAARPGGRVGPSRRRAWWSPRRTRSTEEAVLGLARELQEHLRVLRGCSDRYVMRVIKAFGEAGWSVGDLVVAVDRRPDGSLWPHSGDRGVREPARWLIHRLSAWLDDRGAPLLSWRQKVAGSNPVRGTTASVRSWFGLPVGPAHYSPIYGSGSGPLKVWPASSVMHTCRQPSSPSSSSRLQPGISSTRPSNDHAGSSTHSR